MQCLEENIPLKIVGQNRKHEVDNTEETQTKENINNQWPTGFKNIGCQETK